MLLRGIYKPSVYKPYLRAPSKRFFVTNINSKLASKSAPIIKQTSLFVSPNNFNFNGKYFATNKSKDVNTNAKDPKQQAKQTPQTNDDPYASIREELSKRIDEDEEEEEDVETEADQGEDLEADEHGEPKEEEEEEEDDDLDEEGEEGAPGQATEKKKDFGLTKDQVAHMQKDYVERVLLNAPTTFYLSEQAKNKLVDLYTADPKTWTIKKLAERFQISQGRVMGIVKLGVAEREIEHSFGRPLDDTIHKALYDFVPEQVSEAGNQYEGKPNYKRKIRYKWTFEEPEMNEELLQLMLVGGPKNRDAQKFRQQLPETPPSGVATEPVVIVPPQISKEKLKQRYLLNDRVQRVYVANLSSKYHNDTTRHIFCIEPDGSVRTVTWEERRNLLKNRYVIPKTYSQKIADAFPGDLTAHAEVMRQAKAARQPAPLAEEPPMDEDELMNLEEDKLDMEEPDDELKL